MGNPNELDDADDIRVTLNMDDGNDIECRILTIFDVGEQDYIALLPLDEDGNDNEYGEVFIYSYFEYEDVEPSLDNIASDEEYETVSDRFDELLDEELFDSLEN